MAGCNEEGKCSFGIKAIKYCMTFYNFLYFQADKTKMVHVIKEQKEGITKIF